MLRHRRCHWQNLPWNWVWCWKSVIKESARWLLQSLGLDLLLTQELHFYFKESLVCFLKRTHSEFTDHTCKYKIQLLLVLVCFYSISWKNLSATHLPCAKCIWTWLLQLQLIPTVPQFTSHLAHVTDRKTTPNFNVEHCQTQPRDLQMSSSVAPQSKSALSPLSCKPDFHLALAVKNN